ncbi:MAG: hypothetical protein WBP37_01120, partial [Candidatus Dechloromonas phosphoritropha]
STPCMFVAYRSARAIANMIASSVIRQASIVIPVWFRLVRLRIIDFWLSDGGCITHVFRTKLMVS